VSTPPDPCATCGLCCRVYVVPLVGRDVWRISTRQRLAPEEFVVVYPNPPGAIDGFRLAPDGPLYAMALAKKGRYARHRACVFLLELGGGYSRCGIYADRPDACRVYPMVSWKGMAVQRTDAACPPGAWTSAALRDPSWRDRLQRMDMDMDIYNEVVARWNARVARLPAGTGLPLAEFFSYLLNVYDGLAALERTLDEETLARVVASWSTLPTAADLAAAEHEPDRFPWLRYLQRARAVINRFYPEVPIQRPFALVREEMLARHRPRP